MDKDRRCSAAVQISTTAMFSIEEQPHSKTNQHIQQALKAVMYVLCNRCAFQSAIGRHRGGIFCTSDRSHTDRDRSVQSWRAATFALDLGCSCRPGSAWSVSTGPCRPMAARGSPVPVLAGCFRRCAGKGQTTCAPSARTCVCGSGPPNEPLPAPGGQDCNAGRSPPRLRRWKG